MRKDVPMYLSPREWDEVKDTPLASLYRLAFHEHHVPGLAAFIASFADLQEEHGEEHGFPHTAHVVYDAERVEWIIICMDCGMTAIVTPGSVSIDGKFGPAEYEGECACDEWDEACGHAILEDRMFLGGKPFPRVIFNEQDRAVVYSFLGIGEGNEEGGAQ